MARSQGSAARAGVTATERADRTSAANAANGAANADADISAAGGTAGQRAPKTQRQSRIARLLENYAVTSQTRLVELLALDGVVATQATVSRDLEDLGAVKVRVPGSETIYAIPDAPKDRPAPEDHLRRVLGEWVAEVSWSLNLVVVRTPPGSAHVVASALDRSGIAGVLGTVAGDDTLMIVCEADVGGAVVAARLAELAGLVER